MGQFDGMQSSSLLCVCLCVFPFIHRTTCAIPVASAAVWRAPGPSHWINRSAQIAYSTRQIKMIRKWHNESKTYIDKIKYGWNDEEHNNNSVKRAQ